MRIKNISPYGALDVPILRRPVDAGESVDVDPEHAEALLAQDENWAPDDDAARAIFAALEGVDEGQSNQTAPEASGPGDDVSAGQQWEADGGAAQREGGEGQ
ncbi:hypothetical protein SPF06_07050 [Sinomonas sp. JGH33]|uniref:Uncharacterized protein n=1 Tax=Sinomonas terricola TaxID=3110330 RepID=A0ABU5T482_9MICC|nr:hypothetical protein [Sinomonas sp. JGH33]MEA5454474.1 hypothetical protein [Sinomonas sp. JGH33]